VKRDLNLVRKLLLYFEQYERVHVIPRPEVEGYTAEQIEYHLEIMQEAGLLAGGDLPQPRHATRYVPQRLTWQGHEFLDQSRDETRFKEAQEEVVAKVGGLPFDLLLAVLKEWAKRAVLGDPA